MRQVRKERSLRTETGVPRPGAGFTSSYSYKPPARQQPDSPSSPLQRSVPARAADRRARRGQVIRSGAAVQRIQQQLRPYLSYPLCCLPACHCCRRAEVIAKPSKGPLASRQAIPWQLRAEPGARVCWLCWADRVHALTSHCHVRPAPSIRHRRSD